MAVLALAGAGCAGAPVDTRSYDCEGGGLLHVEITDAVARVEFDGRRYTLESLQAEEGRRWRDGEVLLWIRDGEASVTVGDQVMVWGCRRR
ncbi:MAG TPA: MliC family protein [Woeseiaceae bacterium]|nr:MliC family protein [Woeseiaceae bacterium]